MRKISQLINENLLWDKFSRFFSALPQKSAEPLPLITISREMGAGGKPIAYLVAEKLGQPWQVYHKEIVDEIAMEAHLEKELIEEVDEKEIPLIDQFLADFLGKRRLSLTSYHRHLVKILSAIGKRGYAIVVGRGADYLAPHALKVRIICDMEQRIAWEMEFEKITRKEAIRRIQDSDKKRLEFIKAVYGHDSRKAHHYDLVIRTGPNLSIDDAADLIVTLARKRFKL